VRRQYERVVCPWCQRDISAYVPHGGDGMALRLVRHKPVKNPIQCPGSDELVMVKFGSWVPECEVDEAPGGTKETR
jgi:hypothetical protein